jgi:hypothetical protein
MAAGLMALVPLVAAVWYFSYNVGAVTVLVTEGGIEGFSSVEVTFSEVAVHSTGALTATAWVALDLDATAVELTALGNNLSLPVGSDNLPAGKYTQVRLRVTSAIGELIDGTAVSVLVPSGELRTTTPFDLDPRGSVTVLMSLHVVKAGQTYNLEPTFGQVMGG